VSSSGGSLSGVIHGEVLHLRGSEKDILVWLLNGWDVLFWGAVAQIVNGTSTQSMDLVMGIPSCLGSHGVH
jgi:hypothetical protein